MEAAALKSTTYAMGFQLERKPSTPYVSAPTSPRRVSFNDIHGFYTAPGSPTKGLTSPCAWKSADGLNQGMTIDAVSDDFEFTSGKKSRKTMYHRRQQQQQNHRRRRRGQKFEQLVNMSYADEHSGNGHVLPLKLPPRLQYATDRSSGVSSSRSPKLVLYGPFPGRGFKNKDDFDPFMVALEKVRNDETTRIQWPSYQRSQSFSLLRKNTLGDSLTGRVQVQQQNNEVGQPKPHRGRVLNDEKSRIQWPSHRSQSFSLLRKSTLGDDLTGRVQVQHQNNEMGHPKPPRGQVLTLPKGSNRPMRLDTERITGTMRLEPENSTFRRLAETVKGRGRPSIKVTRRWRSFPKGSKRRMIRDFLLRGASKGRTDHKDKLRDQTAALKLTKDARNLGFYPTKETHDREKSKQAAEERRKAVVPHKQSVFVCLGFSTRAMKIMN